MGAYISVASLSKRMTEAKLAELCTDGGTALSSAERNILLTDVVTRAEGYINSMASRYYATPLPNSPIVQEWCYRIVEYDLYKRGIGDDVPTKYKYSYEEALKELQLFLDGKMAIDGAIQLRQEVGLSLQVDSDTPIFSENAFYVPKQDLVQGIWI